VSPDGSVVALIPARGGSKGLPRKNLADLGGRPLLAWSVESALQATTVDRVVVCTDDEEIAAAARSAGAEVPWVRPAELATDDAADLPVFEHALDRLDAVGPPVEVFVHLRPTSPFREPGLIDRAVSLLRSHPGVDSVRSVSPVAKTPFKMWFVDDEGFMEPVVGSWEEECFNRPRQALPPVWTQDGTLDVVRAGVVRGGSMTGRRVLALRHDSPLVDVDTAEDLERARSIAAD
jgi:CMP-N,N'-diacetyllegionaminic acid synthase